MIKENSQELWQQLKELRVIDLHVSTSLSDDINYTGSQLIMIGRYLQKIELRAETLSDFLQIAQNFYLCTVKKD